VFAEMFFYKRNHGFIKANGKAKRVSFVAFPLVMYDFNVA
jgi:hypothetical protein